MSNTNKYYSIPNKANSINEFIDGVILSNKRVDKNNKNNNNGNNKNKKKGDNNRIDNNSNKQWKNNDSDSSNNDNSDNKGNNNGNNKNNKKGDNNRIDNNNSKSNTNSNSNSKTNINAPENTLIAIDLTGGYEVLVRDIFYNRKDIKKDIILCEGFKVKNYKRSIKHNRAKTDRIDSKVLVDYVKQNLDNLTIYSQLDKTRQEIKSLFQIMQNLKQIRQQELNRLKQPSIINDNETITFNNSYSSNGYNNDNDNDNNNNKDRDSKDNNRTNNGNPNNGNKDNNNTNNNNNTNDNNNYNIKSNAINNASNSLIRETIKEHIEYLSSKIELLTNRILELIESNKEIKIIYDVIINKKGYGINLAIFLIANLQELGKIKRKQLVNLSGLAPITNSSGTFEGHRYLKGGRIEIKSLLYLITMNQLRNNKDIRTKYNNLKNKKHKPSKTAILHIARTNIIKLNAIIRNKLKTIREGIEEEERGEIKKKDKREEMEKAIIERIDREGEGEIGMEEGIKKVEKEKTDKIKNKMEKDKMEKVMDNRIETIINIKKIRKE
jgi:transposase